MNNNVVSTEFLDCPRCGYDLRGNVAQWEEQGVCPLAGTCSECGLDFDWKRVFREAVHPWLFEYHWRRKPISSFFQTWWRSVLPWKFWREVDLFWAVRIWPIVAMLVLCLAGSSMALYGLHAWRNLRGTGIYFRAGYSTKELLAMSVTDLLEVVIESGTLGGMLVWTIGIPLAFCLLPMSLQRAKVRRVHLVRVFCYSTLVLLPTTVVATQLWRIFYWETWELQDWLNEVARWLGTGVAWLLRDLFQVRGVNQDDGAAFFYPLMSGCLVVPYWWYACKGYLRIETPGRVLLATSAIASLAVLVFAMCGLLL